MQTNDIGRGLATIGIWTAIAYMVTNSNHSGFFFILLIGLAVFATICIWDD